MYQLGKSVPASSTSFTAFTSPHFAASQRSILSAELVESGEVVWVLEIHKDRNRAISLAARMQSLEWAGKAERSPQVGITASTYVAL